MSSEMPFALPEAGITVVLLRHGESQANVLDVRQGQGQSPLTSRGLHQAWEQARRWRAWGWRFRRILTSPLHRAFHTAWVFAQVLEVPDINVLDLLQERLLGGHWFRPTALALEEERQRVPVRDRFAPAGGAPPGESPWDLYLRALRVRALLEGLSPGRYLVVAHGVLLNMLTRAMLGLAPTRDFGGPRVKFANLGYMVWHRGSWQGSWTWLAAIAPEAVPGSNVQPD